VGQKDSKNDQNIQFHLYSLKVSANVKIAM